MRKPIFLGRGAVESEDHWISVSDLMAGLMILFMFIAITYIRPVVTERDRIKEIAVTWQEGEVKLHEELEKEFRNDLTRWNAELDKNSLTVRFRAPEVLFDPGSPRLKPEFQSILNDFFPRYVAVLSRFEDNIEEIRIEGHTSSEWEREADQERAYFRNMDLSQARTRAVLEHCLNLSNILDRRSWLREKLTANGLSSSKLIVGTDGQEDRSRSRRVEFRVRTNAKDQIVRILEAVN
jgi:outer membrane protein OmpA-like peptidoglycan-associated protein